jgi:hypothetical protein
LLNPGADTGRALHPDARELDGVGEQGLTSRGPGGVEESAREYERQKLPELDTDRRVEQGNRRHRPCAREVRDDARRPEPKAVDDHSAEDPGEDDGQEAEEDRKSGQRRAARRDEDKPRDRELRYDVADERDRVRDVERIERPASHRRLDPATRRRGAPSRVRLMLNVATLQDLKESGSDGGRESPG